MLQQLLCEHIYNVYGKLSKGVSGVAVQIFTEETTDMQDETDGVSNGGEISQSSCIPTLDARRQGSTAGTGSHWRRGTQGQYDLNSYLYLFNLDIRKVWKNDHRKSLGPQKWKNEKMFNFLVYHILDQRG